MEDIKPYKCQKIHSGENTNLASYFLFCITLHMVGACFWDTSPQLDYLLTMTFLLECLDKASLKHQIHMLKDMLELAKKEIINLWVSFVFPQTTCPTFRCPTVASLAFYLSWLRPKEILSTALLCIILEYYDGSPIEWKEDIFV